MVGGLSAGEHVARAREKNPHATGHELMSLHPHAFHRGPTYIDPAAELRWDPDKHIHALGHSAHEEVKQRILTQEQKLGHAASDVDWNRHEHEVMHDHPHLFMHGGSSLSPEVLKKETASFLHYLQDFIVHYEAGVHLISMLERAALPIEEAGVEIFTPRQIRGDVTFLATRLRSFQALAPKTTIFAHLPPHVVDLDTSARHLAQSGSLRTLHGDQGWMDAHEYAERFRVLDQALLGVVERTRGQRTDDTVAAETLQQLLVRFNALHTMVNHILEHVGFPREPINMQRESQWGKKGLRASLDLSRFQIAQPPSESWSPHVGAPLHAAHLRSRSPSRPVSSFAAQSDSPQGNQYAHALDVAITRALNGGNPELAALKQEYVELTDRAGATFEGGMKLLGLGQLNPSEKDVLKGLLKTAQEDQQEGEYISFFTHLQHALQSGPLAGAQSRSESYSVGQEAA